MNPIGWWQRLKAVWSPAKRSSGRRKATPGLDALWQEKLRYDDMLRAASDAVLRAAPNDMPRIRDRDLAIGIGLAHSGACYVFETDAGLAEAKRRDLTGWLDRATREQLLARGYPKDAIAAFAIRFTTHEEIVRATGGDYYRYFR